VIASLDLRLLRLLWSRCLPRYLLPLLKNQTQQPHRPRPRISTPAHVASLVCASSWSRQTLEEGCGSCDELGSKLRICLHQFHAQRDHNLLKRLLQRRLARCRLDGWSLRGHRSSSGGCHCGGRRAELGRGCTMGSEHRRDGLHSHDSQQPHNHSESNEESGLPSGLVRTRYGTSPTKSAGQAKTAVSLVGRPWAALELGDCRPVRRELHAFVFQGLSTLWHCSMSARGSRCRVWRQRGVSPRGAASLAGQVCPVATFADQMWGQKKQQQQQRQQQAPG